MTTDSSTRNLSWGRWVCSTCSARSAPRCSTSASEGAPSTTAIASPRQPLGTRWTTLRRTPTSVRPGPGLRWTCRPPRGTPSISCPRRRPRLSSCRPGSVDRGLAGRCLPLRRNLLDARSCASWPEVVLVRAGLVPPARDVVLHALVDLGRFRSVRPVVHQNSAHFWISNLRVAGHRVAEGVPARFLLKDAEPHALASPAWADLPRWAGSGSLVTLRARNEAPFPESLEMLLLVDPRGRRGGRESRP